MWNLYEWIVFICTACMILLYYKQLENTFTDFQIHHLIFSDKYSSSGDTLMPTISLGKLSFLLSAGLEMNICQSAETHYS